MFARLAPIAALIAGILLSAQMPGPAGWPPGVFLGRGAIDAPASAGSAMTTPILSGQSASAPSNSGSTQTFYSLITGNGTSNSGGGGNRELPIAISGTLSNFSANFTTTLTQGSYTVAVSVNGSTTSTPVCSITTSVATCSDASHPVSISPSNTVGIVTTPSGTPTSSTNTAWGATFVSTNNNESFLAGGANVPSTSAQNWASIQGWSSWDATSDAIASNVMPAAGTIDQFYVVGSAAPGAGKTYTLTVYQKGSYTAINCTLSGAGTGAGITTCNDLTDSITVAQGDTISVSSCPGTMSAGTCSPVATPASDVIRWGVRWKPTTAGQSLLLVSDAGTPPGTTATNYIFLNGAVVVTAVTEANATVLSPTFSGGFSIASMYVALSAAPTTGTRSVTLMNPSGTPSAAMTCALSLAATSNCSTATAVTSIGASSATLLDWKNISAAATATTSYKIGAVMTVP